MQVYAAEIMSGIGGATRGFLDAGIRVISGVDIDETCRITYEKNNKPATFLKRDIRNLTASDLFAGTELLKEDKFVLIACPPCQPFSTAGIGKPEDSKDIIAEIGRLVREIRPDFVFVENAPGFWKCYPPIYEEFLKPFIELKYHYQFGVRNLKDYGVPQNRRRYLFIASRDYDISLPQRTHGEKLKTYVTVEKTIKKYPPLRAGGQDKRVLNHTCYDLSEITMERLRNTPKNGGSRTSWPNHLVLKCHKNKKGHSDVYGRMSWKKVSPTLTCKCISISNGRFAHPTQNRGISVREAAALQTFSDNFVFYEPKTTAARHIGNAVPPLISQLIAQEILETIKRNNTTCLTYVGTELGNSPSSIIDNELIMEIEQTL